MTRALWTAVLLAWAVAGASFAAGSKDNEAIPYGEDDQEESRPERTSRPRERPTRSEPTRIAPEETDVEKDDRERSLAELDDPNTGLAGELVVGAMLVVSSRGLWWVSDFSVFFQAGGGLAYQFSDLHNGTTELSVAGVKPLIQYGVGLRGRPLISEDGVLRVSFRFELTRFRRQYMDDTFLGGSVGLAF
ncbi:MAG TPA: hypothetical protein VND93_01235 [Myxococcales bacterium]|nr:hypothetical protein [Myxococcales bacterium]